MCLGGVPVLARSLTALNSNPRIDEIVVVTRSEQIVPVAELCNTYHLDKVSKIICGGETRTESVFNGILEMDPKTEIVLIHDGARPLVSQAVIDDAIDGAIAHFAAVPGIPVKDTIKVVKNGCVVETPERANLVAVQTPQAFSADLIKGTLQNALEKKLELTDDGMACEAMGVTVYITNGSEENIKITTPQDLEVAETILAGREGIE